MRVNTMMRQGLCWYIVHTGYNKVGVYEFFNCGRPTKFKMVPDGGEPGAPLVRQYASFCADHKDAAEESE